MSKRVEYEGTIHEFPEDFTDNDISQALSSYKPAKPGAKPALRDTGGPRTANPLLNTAKQSKLESYVSGAGDAVSLGFGDELFGGLMAGMEGALGPWDNKIGRMADTYNRARGFSNEYQAKARGENPVSYTGGQITGSMILPFGKTQTMRSAALKSGAYGGAYGFGSGESLEDRTKKAAAGAVVSAALGAGAQGLLGRTKPTRAQQRIAEFEQAGVRPSLAAVNGGPFAGATKMIEENLIAGIPARVNTRRSLEDTAQAAGRLARSAGAPQSPMALGETVQRGAKRWANDASDPRSFDARATRLYDKAFAPMRGKPAAATKAEAELQSILGRVSDPYRDTLNAPILRNLAQRLEEGRGRTTFEDLRELRSFVRRAKKDDGLRQGADTAALSRLESALTDDIFNAARRYGGPQGVRALHLADRFYRTGMDRIETALRPFADEAGERSFERIIGMASSAGRADVRALNGLRNSLRPDEWGSVQASVIDNMGKPARGSPDAVIDNFSVNTFVTNYAKMSAEGRRALFGNGPLARDLHNLAKVAGYQKAVEAKANFSRSGVVVQNVGSGAALLNPSTTAPAIGALLSGAITGEMLTNPAFVRWLASASKAGKPAGLREQARKLGLLAARDPALQPAYQQLLSASEAASGAQSPPPGAAQQRAAGMRP